MNPKSRAGTVSTAAASGGVTGAVVVLISWALSLANITVPAEVAAAAMVIVAPVVHMIAVRLGVTLDPEPAPAPTPAPAVVTITPTQEPAK